MKWFTFNVAVRSCTVGYFILRELPLPHLNLICSQMLKQNYTISKQVKYFVYEDDVLSL